MIDGLKPFNREVTGDISRPERFGDEDCWSFSGYGCSGFAGVIFGSRTCIGAECQRRLPLLARSYRLASLLHLRQRDDDDELQHCGGIDRLQCFRDGRSGYALSGQPCGSRRCWRLATKRAVDDRHDQQSASAADFHQQSRGPARICAGSDAGDHRERRSPTTRAMCRRTTRFRPVSIAEVSRLRIPAA